MKKPALKKAGSFFGVVAGSDPKNPPLLFPILRRKAFAVYHRAIVGFEE